MIKSLNVRDVVGIRGLHREINDIEDPDCAGVNASPGYEGDAGESVSTLMWNPLHFAVYHQNIDLVKFLIREMKVNWALTAPKAPAENERDSVNNEKYTEDKIMLLLLAFDRRNATMLKLLLDEGYKFWPSKKTLEKLIRERLFSEVTRYCSE